MPILKRLDLFWNHAKCNRKWKLQVYNAVIISKLTYGLENIEGTEAALKLLDTFQLKGLRKILGLNTTFVNRESTNAKVFQLANEAAGVENNTPPKIIPVTQFLRDKKLRLLGHVYRRERTHPMQQASFDTRDGWPKRIEQRRAGRPRINWIQKNIEEAWSMIYRDKHKGECLAVPPFEAHNEEHRKTLSARATNYLPPFCCTVKESNAFRWNLSTNVLDADNE